MKRSAFDRLVEEPAFYVRVQKTKLVIVLVLLVVAWAAGAFGQDKPEVLPEVDRLKAYAVELRGQRDALERRVADLTLYAQRLEKQVADLQAKCPAPAK